MEKIIVSIVTYNRKKYLKKLLEALEKQTAKIDTILIFDNNSTDGTSEFLAECDFIQKSKYYVPKSSDRKIFIRNDENIGGSGGFNEVINIASKGDYDYVWIMDDDVYPEKNCLEILLYYLKKNNKKVAVPSRNDSKYQDRVCLDIDFNDYKKFWTSSRKLNASYPLNNDIYIVKDMPFEGPLISVDVIKKIGLPDSGFFLEYDDTDYALRISAFYEIIYVVAAKIHRQIVSNIKEPKIYDWRMYYRIRNNILFDRKYGQNWKVRFLSPVLLLTHHLVISYRNGSFIRNFGIILKSGIDGFLGKNGKRVNPNY